MRATVASVISAALDQFNFVALGRVDEREPASIFLHDWAVGIFDPMFSQMFSELLQAIHLESQVREVRLHLDRPAGRKMADLDQLLTVRRFEENQFRTAWRLVAADFLQAQNID